MSEATGHESPYLDEHEQQQAAKHAPVGPLVIHEIVREQGQREADRSFSGLAWSGLAAGLSIGFSFLVQAYIQAALPQAPWTRLVDGFGYCTGFLIVVLGQQQLFTETTLTALIPTLLDRTKAAMLRTMRVWAIVLVANLIGTWLFAFMASRHGIFPDPVSAAMTHVAALTTARPFATTMVLGGSAGWLIGLMVWLLPGAGPSRPLIIILLTYVVAICQFPHVIAGSSEAAYAVLTGHSALADYLLRFLLPTLVGNTIGGTALVALLNHAPVAEELGARGRQNGDRRGDGSGDEWRATG
jgi:formate/nitrite transporter FocA (FNT family)